MVDGREARFFTTAGPTIEGKTSALLAHTQRSGWASLADVKTLAIGKQFKVNLDVAVTLATEAEMSGPPQDGNPLNGNLTLTFKQGL